MITLRTSLLILSLLLLQCSVVLCGVIRDGSFTARSDGNNINLNWVSDDEAGALRYEVERKAGVNGQFMFLAPVLLQGNNSSYSYTDDSAFLRIMESIYQYRIKVLFTNGTVAYYGPVTVTHYVSNVRRTWGSIKAMFR